MSLQNDLRRNMQYNKLPKTNICLSIHRKIKPGATLHTILVKRSVDVKLQINNIIISNSYVIAYRVIDMGRTIR